MENDIEENATVGSNLIEMNLMAIDGAEDSEFGNLLSIDGAADNINWYLQSYDANTPAYEAAANEVAADEAINNTAVETADAASVGTLLRIDADVADYSDIADVLGAAEYDGGAQTYVMNVAAHAVDPVLRNIIPEKVTECSLVSDGKAVCVPESITSAVAKIVKSAATSAEEIIEDAKKYTGCDTEKCAISKIMDKHTTKQRARAILTKYFKIEGPTNTKLLSNINIDTVMAQYASKWVDFYPYSFNMVDYASKSFIDGEVIHAPDTLATIDWLSIAEGANILGEPYIRKHKCCGCVINSDTYDGAGKHWMALFADWRGDKCTVEFFNSSGNAPVPEYCNWMVKTKIAMEQAGRSAECINVSSIRHQHSRSECGVYALMYIYARLNGIPYTYFAQTPVPDNVMFEFRQHLFSGGDYVNEGRFDLKKFKAGVQIDWEVGHNT